MGAPRPLDLRHLNDVRAPKAPSPLQIRTAVAALGVAGIEALCAALWPALPWLPKAVGEDSARLTPWRWRIDPPLADGRRAWEAPCADWLWCELEALVRRGHLERAPEGEAPFVDAIRTARWRVPAPVRAELHREEEEEDPVGPKRRRRPLDRRTTWVRSPLPAVRP